MAILDVAVKAGNVDQSIGMAVRFFKLAQERYKTGSVITEKEFAALNFSEALFPTIAERVPGGIQAVNADEHFSWLRQRVLAGQKGGKSKSEAKTRSLKQNQQLSSEAKPKQNRSGTEASPSPSPSYSSERVLSSSSGGNGGRTARGSLVSDAKRFEDRFKNHESPDREKYRDVLRGFVLRTDPRLKSFQTERFVDQAMQAFTKPDHFFDYLESLEQTWRSKKPDNPQAYFKTSWRENVLDRVGDVAIAPASAEGVK